MNRVVARVNFTFHDKQKPASRWGTINRTILRVVYDIQLRFYVHYALDVDGPEFTDGRSTAHTLAANNRKLPDVARTSIVPTNGRVTTTPRVYQTVYSTSVTNINIGGCSEAQTSRYRINYNNATKTFNDFTQKWFVCSCWYRPTIQHTQSGAAIQKLATAFAAGAPNSGMHC
jgi:hypothetical protein